MPRSLLKIVFLGSFLLCEGHLIIGCGSFGNSGEEAKKGPPKLNNTESRAIKVDNSSANGEVEYFTMYGYNPICKTMVAALTCSVDTGELTWKEYQKRAMMREQVFKDVCEEKSGTLYKCENSTCQFNAYSCTKNVSLILKDMPEFAD